MLGPSQSLPLPAEFQSTDEYVDSLLDLVATDARLQTLCGGVHILDFFTRSPDLYSTILPQDWRDWFESHDIDEILDLLNRQDALQLIEWLKDTGPRPAEWRGRSLPPQSLIRYVYDVRRHCLNTSFTATSDIPVFEPKAKNGKKYTPSLRAMTAGMNPKKLHEVTNFAHFVADLAERIEDDPGTGDHKISHIVDFGSGQNYLGRTLASEPYCRDIVAVESRAHVVKGAQRMDSKVNLVDQKLVMRNKKQFRTTGIDTTNEASGTDKTLPVQDVNGSNAINGHVGSPDLLRTADLTIGQVQYIEHRIHDGNLSDVVRKIEMRPVVEDQATKDPSLMVISLHSCGNLLHHGLRSIVLNPSVRAVAMIGCCYNLMTERAGSPSFKLPALRNNHPRLLEPASHDDPHGFPMSCRFFNYKHKSMQDSQADTEREPGIRLNITARMMAVQAPRNWTTESSQAFFTRHFYRALLQRILMDTGVVGSPSDMSQMADGGRSPAGTGSTALDGTAPVIIGNLSKACYVNFVLYVRGAVDKLCKPFASDSMTTIDDQASARNTAMFARAKIDALSDDDLRDYERRYSHGRKHLSVVWSLMAFSAQVIEAAIVVDRWLWLKEQDVVDEAWVQTAFDYSKSPRNMVVIGIKKTTASLDQQTSVEDTPNANLANGP